MSGWETNGQVIMGTLSVRLVGIARILSTIGTRHAAIDDESAIV